MASIYGIIRGGLRVHASQIFGDDGYTVVVVPEATGDDNPADVRVVVTLLVIPLEGTRQYGPAEKDVVTHHNVTYSIECGGAHLSSAIAAVDAIVAFTRAARGATIKASVLSSDGSTKVLEDHSFMDTRVVDYQPPSASADGSRYGIILTTEMLQARTA